MVFHKSYRDGVLRLNDGASEAATLTVSGGDLTLKFTDDKNFVLDRGRLASADGEVKLSDQKPVEWSLSYYLERIGVVASAPLTDSFYEILTKTGDGANWATTRPSSDVHCVNMKFQMLDADGVSLEEVLTFADVYYTSISIEEGDPSMVKITGQGLVLLPSIGPT